MAWKVGVDIGGAFTDVYAIDIENEKNAFIKVESTPPNFEKGVLNGLAQLERQGILLKDTSQIIHGQTVVINTIITRTGANVGFITTKGYDILEIQRSNRRDIFNLKYNKPKSFVPRFMTRWVGERIDSDGSIYKEMNLDEIEDAAKSLMKNGAESIAIGFINSYQNPIHEIKAKEIVEKALLENGIKNPYVTISSDLSREWREYERFNTAVLNAYVQPIFTKYIKVLEEKLKRNGFKGVFYITLAAGGMATTDYVKKFPITSIEGGPVAGIIGSISIGRNLNEKDIIVIDGGSTTTKAGLAKNLSPQINTEYWIEQDEYNPGYPTRVPVISINEIGTGGTSFIWADEAGNLQVGPKAAGSRPGPASYGMGGDKPTLTDAYVVAGYVNPSYLLGGKLRINKELAEKSFDELSKQLNIEVKDLAYGAIRVANDNSANLIRLISIRRGFDPRDFALISHGGSGPMMAPFIAEELGIPKIVIPSIPSGVFNSWGMIGLDIRHELIQTSVTPIVETKECLRLINSTFINLENKIYDTFFEENIDKDSVETQWFADLQYEGQAHTLKVPCKNKQLDFLDIKELKLKFNELHLKEFGFDLPESNVDIVNFDVAGINKVIHPKIGKSENDFSIENAFIEDRNIYDGKQETKVPVYKKERLPSNTKLKGFCIIEGDTSTIIVTEKFEAIHDQYGNIIITRNELKN